MSRRKLEDALGSVPCIASQGTVFRSIDLHWLLQGTPLSAIGSRMHGGRYNPKGRFEAFYAADTQLTALYEVESIYNSGGNVVGIRQPPRVMLSLDYRLRRVLDLTANATLERLGFDVDDLKRPWKLAQAEGRPVLTQRIGSAARLVDIKALLVPSARVANAKNLVIFEDRLHEGSIVTLFVGERSFIPRYTIEGQYAPSPAS